MVSLLIKQQIESRNIPRILALSAAAALTLAGCAADGNSAVDAEPIVLGVSMTNRVLDPAGTLYIGDQMLMHQLYPMLVNSQPGSAELQPDITVSAEYVDATTYRVVLKPDLTFANGNQLTSSDVVFSLQRQVAIADSFGPSVLLANFVSATAVDELTVDIEVAVDFDETFPHALSSIAGAIVDEEVFAADRLLTNEEIVAGSPFAGPYTLGAFELNELIEFLPNPNYQGLWEIKNSGVLMVNFDDPNNMMLAFEAGDVELALVYRTLASTDLARIAEASDATVHAGDAAEPGFIAFDQAAAPFGTNTAEPDPVKAKAVRQAVAHLIGEKQIVEEVFAGTAQIAHSTVPSGLFGNYPAFDRYGSSDGSPDLEAAQQVLAAAGITEPVVLDLTYSSDRFGQDMIPVFAIVKQQLENGGLFQVNLSNTDADSWSSGRREGKFPLWSHNWGPDYGDSANYLSVIFQTGGALRTGYSNPEVDLLAVQQASESNLDARAELLKQMQILIAEDVPIVPLYERGRSVVANNAIKGVAETLDVSFKFRFANLER